MEKKRSGLTLHALSVPLLFVTLLSGNVSLAGTSGNVVDISDIGHRNWKMESFSLDKRLDLHVEVRGVEIQWQDVMYASAWILDARSRDVVWEMDLDNTSWKRDRNGRIYEGLISLPEGDYEVYFALSTFLVEIHIKGLGDLLESIFHGLQEKQYSKDWGISIDVTDERDMKFIHRYDKRQRDKNMIIQMIRMGDDEFRREGFTLKRQSIVRIYAVGEGSRSDGEMSDYGWIVDAKSRKRIWEMSSRNTDHAGGADKNLLYDGQITLPAGSYIVYYVTDGSHSYERWNTRPPYDPTHWGMTLWAVDSDFTSQDVLPFAKAKAKKPFVEITQMGDNEFKSRGFTLLRPGDLHIYAVGEYTSDTFYDYGIILDAHTREKVWSMTRYNTHHAGGGKKNRLHDDIVRFLPGDYIVYYITDDSHSYGDWNAGPPYDPEAWGITIWAAEDSFEPGDIREYIADKDPRILIDLTRLGDREQRIERFSLEATTRIRIYAIGEGDRGDMYDYGWVEDKKGRVVWKMTYRNTEHAGGAQKNRLFNNTLLLEAGDYVVSFVTDGSHSFGRWNSNPPYDPFHWGVVVVKDE